MGLRIVKVKRRQNDETAVKFGPKRNESERRINWNRGAVSQDSLLRCRASSRYFVRLQSQTTEKEPKMFGPKRNESERRTNRDVEAEQWPAVVWYTVGLNGLADCQSQKTSK